MKKNIVKIALLLAVLIFISACPVPAAPAGSNRVKVLIAFSEQPGNVEEAFVRAFGGEITYTYTLVPAIAATIPEGAVSGLLRNPKIIRIEEDITVYAIGELENSWGVMRIGAGQVHTAGNTGTGVKVAVIDSGVDHTHPELVANYTGGYDFVNKDNDPADDNGHGTHVAGTIAAVKNDNGVVGVAPDARIFALKVLGADGSGSFSDVIAALEWCVENGIQVTNNSYGSSVDPGLTVRAAFDSSYTAGVLHIGSAGNSGNPSGRGDNVGYPAKYASVIAVAATDKSDKRATFSSTGPDVEISAPGVSIVSTIPGGGYASYSGTSMASPHVAGTAALIISSGVTGPANIRQRLIQTAVDLGAAGKDNLYGYGLVNAFEAAGAPADNSPVIEIKSPANNAVCHYNEEISFTATAQDAEDGDIAKDILWSSDKDGALGTGGTISTSLTEGVHIITAVVTDSDSNTSSASVTVSVINDAPVVYITSPVDGGTYSSGEIIPFTATANDTEQGDLSSNISWTSSIDGSIGYGSSFNDSLSDGTHIITTSVTDEKGKTGSAHVTITVGSPPVNDKTVTAEAVTYSTEGGRAGTAHLRVFVKLIDDSGLPVANATVRIELFRNDTLYASLSGVSDSSGTASYKVNNAPAGSYSVVIKDITAAGLIWDGITPVNGYTKQ